MQTPNYYDHIGSTKPAYETVAAPSGNDALAAHIRHHLDVVRAAVDDQAQAEIDAHAEVIASGEHLRAVRAQCEAMVADAERRWQAAIAIAAEFRAMREAS